MNKCLHCGKEIAEGRKFCSRSCSASYNNVRRERKPWTEEQHLQNTKPVGQKICKYCGTLLNLQKGERSVCTECNRYRQTISFSTKLEKVKGPLKLRYLEAAKVLWEQYKAGQSCVDLHKKYGVPTNRIAESFKILGQNVRSREEAQRQVIARDGIPNTEGKYKSGYHTSWEGFRFWYRSSYELEYAKFLDLNRVPYRVEDLRIRYWDSSTKQHRVAIPDFYLVTSKELVEIKSEYTLDIQNMRDKFKAYVELGYKPKLLVNGVERNIN